jgi:hypothetical protein
MTARAYPDGCDCVWIAADRNGNLGAFVTAGVGPIPALTLNNDALPVEEIEMMLDELPQVSDFHLLASMKRPDDFISLAERGFFVYDWSDVHRSTKKYIRVYEQIAVPLKPITLDALPTLLKKIAMDIKFHNEVFIEGKNVDVKGQCDCCE